MTHRKFFLGTIVATRGALAALAESNQTPQEFITRHVVGDWGEVDSHDTLENERALKEGFRLLSAYTLKPPTKLWVITEADRSVTTLLLTQEY